MRFKTNGKEKWCEDAPDPPDSRTQNGKALLSLKCNDAHFRFWQKAWGIKEYFGYLVSTILEVFSDHSIVLEVSAVDIIAESFKFKTGKKLPNKDSAVKIYTPSFIEGVKKVLADDISTKSQEDSWLNLWLISKGLFDFAISERVKLKSDTEDKTYDWHIVVLDPKNIALSNYRSVLRELKKFNLPKSSYGIARFDAELVLRFSQEMLNQSCQTSRKQKLVSNFGGSTFGKKGQVYGLKDIFSLGLPDWIKIRPNEIHKAIAFHKVLEEHLSVIQSLDQKETEMLMAYRDFVTGINFNLFFLFQVQYADYVIKQLADTKAKNPYLFSTKTLDIMAKNFINNKEWSIDEIIKNKGFIRIAKAINQSTVYAGKIRTSNGIIELDWQRNYGLAQRLSSQADSEEDFIKELAIFLHSYEKENVRLTEKLQKEGKLLYRVWTTKEDLDEVLALIKDKRFGCSLVANLLIAYGYAKWSKKSSNEEPEDEFDLAED